MSTTHHQVVGKCKSSEAREFMGETFSGAKPIVFSGNVAPGVAEVGSLFPRVRFSICKSCRQKSAQDCSKSSICISRCKKTESFGALLEDQVGKMCARL